MATPAQLKLDVRTPGPSVAIIDVHGEVTGAAETPLMNAYETATQHGARTIIINCTDLEYMNSSGIGLLVTLLIRINRQKQRMFSYGLSDHYQQIFQLTRLNEAISIYPDETSALRAADWYSQARDTRTRREVFYVQPTSNRPTEIVRTGVGQTYRALAGGRRNAAGRN